MKNIGFGIIGSGSAAKYHINALAEAAGAELIGIYSVDKKSAEITANENGVRCFDSIDDLLGCQEVEAVSICTPSGTHADIAERLLRAGKHVLQVHQDY